MSRCTVAGVRADPTYGGGVGVAALPPWPEGGGLPSSLRPSVRLDEVSISDVDLAGVYLATPGRYAIADSRIEGGSDRAFPTIFPSGNAVFVTGWVGARMALGPPSANQLTIRATELYGAEGGALFLDRSTATLSGNTWSENGLDILQQRCGAVEVPAGADEATTVELCTGEDLRVEEIPVFADETPAFTR